MRHSVPALTALMAAALLSVSACTASSGTFLSMEREQLPEDHLPVEVQQSQVPDLDQASTRLATTHQGRDYYLATAQAGALGCLLVVPQDRTQQFVGGCGALDDTRPGSGIPIVTLEALGGAASLIPDGAQTSSLSDAAWSEIHPNIGIRDFSS
ncbi:hypothetical protein [Glutamicibacter uratoxydans]|uniref:hypothetical protein n=1 Tax=Glutamicibacter uratoxydans TaxID=43667 RepID=UPI003D6FFFB6